MLPVVGQLVRLQAFRHHKGYPRISHFLYGAGCYPVVHRGQVERAAPHFLDDLLPAFAKRGLQAEDDSPAVSRSSLSVCLGAGQQEVRPGSSHRGLLVEGQSTVSEQSADVQLERLPGPGLALLAGTQEQPVQVGESAHGGNDNVGQRGSLGKQFRQQLRSAVPGRAVWESWRISSTAQRAAA